jgi:hypothetical protein
MRDGKEIAAPIQRMANARSKKGTGLARVLHRFVLRQADGDPGSFSGFGSRIAVVRKFRGKPLFTEPVFRHDRA